MKRTLLILVAAIGLVIVQRSAAVNSWSDPTGDSGTAPDITNVTVSNTSDGVLTFRIDARFGPGTRAAALVDGMSGGVEIGRPRVVWVDINSSGAASSGASIYRGPVVPEITVPASVSSDSVTFSVSAEPLEIDDMFVFRAYSMNLANGNVDNVPNSSGMLFYRLTGPAPSPAPPPVKPLIGKPTGRAAPVAGKKFTVSFPIKRSDDGKPLLAGTAECKTTVAGKTVPHTHTFNGGVLRATVKVPKAAKGKQLKIAVKVTADTAATKVFTFKVK